jgi:DNA-binding MarR family transcriptional regulator
MEKAKLVERVGCPTDRRGVWATLTETGMDTLRSAAPSHVEAVRSYFVDAVDADDYAALGRAFRAVIETTDQV